MKRIIGLPGDTVEIRDGFVYLNKKVLKEPYILKSRSTYGGEFLPDCTVLTIPSNKIFVLGDNRKSSDDSRFDLGLVEIKDITSVIPMSDQEDLKKHWRNTEDDLKTANLPVLDVSEYIKLLNQKRQEAGLKPLKYKEKLSLSAQKRAAVILKYNDLSFEATRSGYTMERALNEVGYDNTVWGEAPTIGFYESEELLDNYFQFPKTKQFLLKSDFEETGIAAQIGQINNCPVQIVVQHFAGFVPPNYSQEAINSWGTVIDNLYKVIASWEKAKDYKNVNQEELDLLLGYLYQRKNYAESIYNTMKANQWLSAQQKEMVRDDENLSKKIEELAKRLNAKY